MFEGAVAMAVASQTQRSLADRLPYPMRPGKGCKSPLKITTFAKYDQSIISHRHDTVANGLCWAPHPGQRVRKDRSPRGALQASERPLTLQARSSRYRCC